MPELIPQQGPFQPIPPFARTGSVCTSVVPDVAAGAAPLAALVLFDKSLLRVTAYSLWNHGNLFGSPVGVGNLNRFGQDAVVVPNESEYWALLCEGFDPLTQPQPLYTLFRVRWELHT